MTGVFRPSDHPDVAADAGVAALFGGLFGDHPDPAFDRNHTGLAIVARNPVVALPLARLSRALLLETGWADRPALRELAIATVNTHYRSAFSLAARRAAAAAAGLDDALLAALPDWRTSDLFDDAQRLVIAYCEAVMAGDVPDALFARVRDAYGETGAIELTGIVALWSAWAMIINAADPAY